MPENTYFLISLLCALQGVLLSLVFIRRKNGHPAGRLLGAYLFLFSVGMLENYLAEKLPGFSGKLVYSFLGFSNFLYGPLLYLFVHFLTVKEPRFKGRQMLHLLPFTLFFLIDFALLLVSGKSLRGDWPLVELVLFELLVLQLLTYNLVAIRVLTQYRQSILHIHSSLEEKDLRWLQHLLIGLTGVYLLSFSITHLLVLGFEGAENAYVLVQVLITTIIYLMSYRMLFQPALFVLPKPRLAPESTAEESAESSTEKYQRSGMTSIQAEAYAVQLLAFMDTEKPHLDPDLTMHNLAGKLGISRNHLTEVINKTLGRNFYEFINAYRVEEVKLLLTDTRFAHLNLAALGLEAGFKSKTAFNTNFKKFTGFTPSKWKANTGHNHDIELKEVLS